MATIHEPTMASAIEGVIHLRNQGFTADITLITPEGNAIVDVQGNTEVFTFTGRTTTATRIQGPASTDTMEE